MPLVERFGAAYWLTSPSNGKGRRLWVNGVMLEKVSGSANTTESIAMTSLKPI